MQQNEVLSSQFTCSVLYLVLSRRQVDKKAGTLAIDLKSSAYSELKTAGGSVVSGKIIIMNISGTFVGLSSICTHENCTVEYLPARNSLQCPCQGSLYTTTGSVISGPAPAALRSYTITRSGDILTINL